MLAYHEQRPLQSLLCCHERERHDGALSDTGAEDRICLRGDAYGVLGAADSKVFQDPAGPLQQHALLQLGWWHWGAGERDVWICPYLTQGHKLDTSSSPTEVCVHTHAETLSIAVQNHCTWHSFMTYVWCTEPRHWSSKCCSTCAFLGQSLSPVCGYTLVVCADAVSYSLHFCQGLCFSSSLGTELGRSSL